MSDEERIEALIVAKGLTAPRVEPAKIDKQIVDVDFYVFPKTMMTVCCLTLVNGFNTIGFSACASPENFNAEIGRDIAFRNARQEIWALEGYRLKQKLYVASLEHDQANKAMIGLPKGVQRTDADAERQNEPAFDRLKHNEQEAEKRRQQNTQPPKYRDEDDVNNQEGA